MDRPNIVLIMTDQQRYDTIRELGFDHVHTPNLDRLVQEGVSFDQCFCTAPSCVPSRASFFQMGYPHMTGVLNNDDQWGRSWVQAFQTAGYHTISVGKMHTNPFDATCGFDQRFVVENKDRKMRLYRPHGGFYDEWDKYLANNDQRKPSRTTYRNEYPGFTDALGAFEWPLEERYHPDGFVGTMARWVVEQRESSAPFFLHIGFPGPHPPYDPPGRLLREYDGVEMPVLQVTEEELKRQPPPHATYRKQMMEADHDAVHWKERPSVEELQRLWRHYAANISLIDEQIGKVLGALRRKGYLDNAIVVFTSDHGDALGEHGHIQKWTMYDCVMRVPMVLWGPRSLPGGVRRYELLQHMDIVPTLFDLANVGLPHSGAVLSALDVAHGKADGRSVVFAEQGPDKRLEDVAYETMARTRDWKLVHYLDAAWGELYDLQSDPDEVRNLWDDERFSGRKEELYAAIRDWRLRSTLASRSDDKG